MELVSVFKHIKKDQFEVQTLLKRLEQRRAKQKDIIQQTTIRLNTELSSLDLKL